MTIHLLPSEQALQGVTVTASRPSFKMEQGQFVTHIQGTVFSQLGLATDVLQQLPLIDTDGIKVLGRGVPLVYINNKRMRNWNELTRIPSNMIKDVKIDMNPGAKYGSSVRAVLYITTIKPVGEGLGGSLILSENVSSCWNTTGWLDLNYRRRGLDFFVNTSANTFSNSHYKRQDVYDFQYKGQDIHADYSGDGYNSAKTGFVSVGVNDQLTDDSLWEPLILSQGCSPTVQTKTIATMCGRTVLSASLTPGPLSPRKMATTMSAPITKINSAISFLST